MQEVQEPETILGDLQVPMELECWQVLEEEEGAAVIQLPHGQEELQEV
jgi:hypothetical protein